jgi:predicted signal transduction protein with EAL and GGDEF domain
LAEITEPIDFASFSIIPEATIGFAALSINDANAVTTARNADHALYRAKLANRGGYMAYTQEMSDPLAARLSISTLQAAISEGRLRAWYQPIVSLGDRRIVALEALCRMMTPEGAIIPAGAFAEATIAPGVASELTR